MDPTELQLRLDVIQSDPGSAREDEVSLVVALTLGAQPDASRALRREAAAAMAAIARHADDSLGAADCRSRVAPITDAVPALVALLMRQDPIGQAATASIAGAIPYVGIDEESSSQIDAALADQPVGQNLRLLSLLCYERIPTQRAAAALDRASAADAHAADAIEVARRFAARRTLRAHAVTMKQERTVFTDPHGVQGFVEQAWEPVTRTCELIEALMPSARWVPTDPPLVAGKGSPIFTYMTIRLMKRLGVPYGGVEYLIVGANYHVESILQMARAERAGIPREQAILQTRSLPSVLTPMTQSGHAYLAFVVRGGRRGPLSDVLAWHTRRSPDIRDRTQEHAALLETFGMTLDDEVFYGYEVHVPLRPYNETTDRAS